MFIILSYLDSGVEDDTFYLLDDEAISLILKDNKNKIDFLAKFNFEKQKLISGNENCLNVRI